MEAEGAKLRALLLNALSKQGTPPVKAVDLMPHAQAGVASLGDVMAELGVKGRKHGNS